MTLHQMFSNRNIATFYLILMCVQLVAVEGFGVSPVKVVAMSLVSIVFLFKVPYISKAFVLGFLYLSVVFLGANMQQYIRFSTIGYLAMFVFTFIAYYNLVYSGAFSPNFFIKLLHGFIFVFFICALFQQLCSGVGIRYMPVFNMVGQSYLSPMHFNTLTFEPSSSARILAFLYLAYLRMLEFRIGYEPTLRSLFTEYKWTTIPFLYTMLMMGSGTAIVCLIILFLYFVSRRRLFLILSVFLVFYFVVPFIEYVPLQRALNTCNAAMTLDVEEVSKMDNSAAARINPLINTLTEMDLVSSETWFGKGTVSEGQRGKWYKSINSSKIGNIDQYGLLSYMVTLIFIFSCCIKKIFSIETLLAFFTIGLTINNFSYVWGCYLILATVKYFTIYYKKTDE